MEIIDWTGKTITIGDTVLFTNCSGRDQGLHYGTVFNIDTNHYRNYGDKTRVHVEKEKGNKQVIIEDLHPIAFSSLTKFKKD